MSEFLVIRLTEDPTRASWLTLSEQGHRLGATTSGALAEAAAESRGRRVLLLVPGVDAVTTRVKLPVKRQSRIEQMLPFTLEDAVAEDVDRLLFAAGPRRADGSIPVAIVARDRVRGWLERCADSGIAVDAIFVDVQGVPETPSNLTLLLEGRTIFGRLPDREPFVFEDFSVEELIEILAAESNPSAFLDHIVVYADDDGYRRFEEELRRLRERASSVDVQMLPDGALPRLASTLVTEPGSNLLQGPFRVQSDWNELLRPWRLPAALAVGLVLAATLGQAARYFSLDREEQALTGLLESSCQSAFATSSLSACEAEIRSRLAVAGDDTAAAAGDAFLETLVSVAAARDERLLIQAMTFRDGVTNLRVIAPDVQSLDSLAQALGSDGKFQANIQSAVPGDDGVEGRLQIAELDR